MGAGDPAGVAVNPDGRVAVALAGVDEVAFLRADGTPTKRLSVGRRPTGVVPFSGGRFVVLNTFDDSLSVIDARDEAVSRTIPLGPEPRLSPRDRGELLFHDARLSYQGWMSCHSCHTDGHTNGLRADTLGDGTHGTPKRTPTLLNTRLTDPWAWDGSMKYLHEQVEKSLSQTMHAQTIEPATIADLTSYLASLPPPPPSHPVGGEDDRQQVLRGRKLFEDRGCVRCHIPSVTYTSHGSHDVGFADEAGRRAFNPPSLRGVGQGYRFLHDGRAASLEEVFTRHRHKVGAGLEPDQTEDLVRFLRSL
jgi:YVTN family beta-propeller protein